MNTNCVRLSGELSDEFCLSHELHGESFYQGMIAVSRLSGAVDHLPCMVPGILLTQIKVPSQVTLEAQLRSYRRVGAGSSRLQLIAFVRKVSPFLGDGINEVELCGTLLRDSMMRMTPLGREITDLLVSVDRMHGKKDCVPCIAWGKHAHACKSLLSGQNIHLCGRLQSRAYQKQLPNGIIEDRTTYEVSIGSIFSEHEDT